MKNIFIAGQNGMVGSSIKRLLLSKYNNIHIINSSKKSLNLINQQQVLDFFKKNKINEVYLAAAKVGGIYANNTYPAEFIYNNLMIISNVLHACYLENVEKVLYLGSSCIYPKTATNPITEDALLTDKLEETNEPYAISKIAGIKMCESYNRQYDTDFRSVMPCNLYGKGDNYHDNESHVIPALIKRFHEAKLNNDKTVIVWGSGKPRREFLYVDDLTNACIHIMNLKRDDYRKITKPMCSHINVGNGSEITIEDLANQISDIVGFKGEIEFDTSMPDGTMQKLIDSSLLRSTGWQPNISLRTGLKLAYKDFMESNRK